MSLSHSFHVSDIRPGLCHAGPWFLRLVRFISDLDNLFFDVINIANVAQVVSATVSRIGAASAVNLARFADGDFALNAVMTKIFPHDFICHFFHCLDPSVCGFAPLATLDIRIGVYIVNIFFYTYCVIFT